MPIKYSTMDADRINKPVPSAKPRSIDKDELRKILDKQSKDIETLLDRVTKLETIVHDIRAFLVI